MRRLLLCLLLAATGHAAASPPTAAPIVGVLGQRVSTDPSFPSSLGTWYIPASYVKWLESAGARVAPIEPDVSDERLYALLGSLNGVLFPGGDYTLNRTVYEATSAKIFAYVLERAKASDPFPLWGTCQGFEQLALLGSGNASILSGPYDSEDLSLPLDFTAAAASSRLFGSLSAASRDALASQRCTENLHEWGVSPQSFADDPRLPVLFDALSLNADRKGKIFVSSLEGKQQLPIWGTQFHPERNAFEFDPRTEPIDHAQPCVRAMFEMVSFFVEQCKQSTHRFPSVEAQAAALIYRVNVTYTAPWNSYYRQTYFW